MLTQVLAGMVTSLTPEQQQRKSLSQIIINELFHTIIFDLMNCLQHAKIIVDRRPTTIQLRKMEVQILEVDSPKMHLTSTKPNLEVIGQIVTKIK